MKTISLLIKRIAWGLINPIFLRSHNKEYYNWCNKFWGLNLGCGLENAPNWLGIDGGVFVILGILPTFILRFMYSIFNYSKIYNFSEYIYKLKHLPIIHWDLRRGIPFANNSVPYIYSSHFLEHLNYNDSVKLMRECYRVLKKCGVLRVVVPNIEKANNPNNDAISINIKHDFHKHKYTYSTDKLISIFKQVGFRFTFNEQFQKGKFIYLKDLEFRKNSIYVEAIK